MSPAFKAKNEKCGKNKLCGLKSAWDFLTD